MVYSLILTLHIRQIRLVDDDLKDVSPGQIGEIITLTPTVFL